MGEARRGSCRNGSGGNGIDADAGGSELMGKVAYSAFKRSFRSWLLMVYT